MYKLKTKQSILMRVTAGITVTAFFFNASYGYAQIGAPINLGTPEIRFSNKVGDIVIPEDLGFIRERYASPNSNSPLVVHIQDAHASVEAQHNIRSIIEFLNRQYGFSLVLLEGGSGQLDPSLLQIFKDPKYNAEMIEYLMREGEVNGSTAAVTESAYDKDAHIIPYGLESREAYEKDLKQFKKVWSNLEIGHRFTQKLSQSIDRAASKYANKDLRAFLKEWQWFKESKSHLNSYLNYLQKISKSVLKLDLTDPREQRDWPILVRIFRLKEFEPKLNLKDAEQEWHAARTFLENIKVEKVILDEIDTRLHKQKHGELAELSTRDLFEGLLDEAMPKGFSFKDYPALSTWTGSVILKDEVGSEEIFQEIEKLNDKIFGELAREKDEEQIVELHKQTFLLNDLFHLELSRNDYLRLRTGKNLFSPEAMIERVESMDIASDLLSKHEINQAQKLYAECLKSYEFAFLRESAFFENLKKAFQSSREGKAITVTGGFHTNGFAEKLKESSISYLIVSPKINSFDNVKEEEHNYVKSLLQIPTKELKSSLRAPETFLQPLKASSPRLIQFRQNEIDIARNEIRRRHQNENPASFELTTQAGVRVGAVETGRIRPGDKIMQQFKGEVPVAISSRVPQSPTPDFDSSIKRAEARLLDVGNLLGFILFGSGRKTTVQESAANLNKASAPSVISNVPLPVIQKPRITESQKKLLIGAQHSKNAVLQIAGIAFGAVPEKFIQGLTPQEFRSLFEHDLNSSIPDTIPREEVVSVETQQTVVPIHISDLAAHQSNIQAHTIEILNAANLSNIKLFELTLWDAALNPNLILNYMVIGRPSDVQIKNFRVQLLNRLNRIRQDLGKAPARETQIQVSSSIDIRSLRRDITRSIIAQKGVASVVVATDERVLNAITLPSFKVLNDVEDNEAKIIALRSEVDKIALGQRKAPMNEVVKGSSLITAVLELAKKAWQRIAGSA